MPARKLTDSLVHITSASISESLWKFVEEHVNLDCQYCRQAVLPTKKCPALTSIQEKLVDVPDDAYRYILFNNFEKKFKKEWDDRYYNADIRNKRIRFQKLLFSLKPDCKCFKIHDVHATVFEAFYFGKKFGKNIMSIYLTDESKLYENIPRNAEAQWSLIFSLIRNVQLISFDGIEVTESLLSCIGKECVQLKVLKQVNLLHDMVTEDSFMKLCFRGGDINNKNNCCRTLDTVELTNAVIFYDNNQRVVSGVATTFMYDVYNILLLHLDNLKCLSRQFLVEKYFVQYGNMEFPESSLTEVHSNVMNLQTFLLFQQRFPQCKKLHIATDQIEDVWSLLSQLPNLEELELINYNRHPIWHLDGFLYDEIMVIAWAHLKRLEISCPIGNLNLSSFAEVFPVLESLKAKCEFAAWDDRTFFRNLKKIDLQLEDLVSFNLMRSFSPTIEDIYISFPFVQLVLQDILPILITMQFPNLRYLKIYPAEFNRDFARCIIAMCPQIQTLGYFSFRDGNEESREAFQAFQNEMKNQNYDISIVSFD